ncbi:Methyltransferase, FkbM family [Azospirillum endophyticum]
MNSYKKIQFPHNGDMASFLLSPPLGRALEAGFFHEQFTSLTFLELLRPGDTVIDIGACVGYYSLLSFAAMRGQGRILAFEPNPETYVRLARHIAANDASCIMAFNAALSDKVGAGRILANSQDIGLSRVLGAEDKVGEGEAVFPCTALCLDDLVEDLQLTTIRLMKIDAEGHEQHVMKGAHRTLSRRLPDYVVCEINRGELLRNGFGEIPLRKAFEEYGYQAELINNIGVDLCGGRNRKPYPLPEVVETNTVFNLLFRRAS